MEEGRASIMQMLARLPRPLPSSVTKKSISLTDGEQWMLIVAKKVHAVTKLLMQHFSVSANSCIIQCERE